MCMYEQGGSDMTGTVTGLFTHKQSRLYLNHLVCHNVTMDISDQLTDYQLN